MGNAESCLGVGVDQALIARLHAWRYILSLPRLVATTKRAVKDLEHQGAELVSIDSLVGTALDGIPARPSEFWRCVPPRVGYKAAIRLERPFSSTERWLEMLGSHVNHRLVIFNITEDLKSAELPFPAFGGIYRSYLQTTVDRRCLVVDEFDCSLFFISIVPCHEVLYFACGYTHRNIVKAPFCRLGAKAFPLNRPPQRH